MTAYSSKSGKGNGVISFKIEKENVTLNYNSRDGGIRSLIYSYDISGVEHVENIKKHALSSENLNGYLNTNRIHCKKVA